MKIRKKEKLNMKNALFGILALAFVFAPINNIRAQEHEGLVTLEHGAHRIGKRTDKAMQEWRDYGLGQFIHWGLYSILGGDYNGKHYPGAAEWIRSWDGIPNEEYDALIEEFNPENYDPEQWAQMAKDMGVKYVILTTKHHDGFALWPSEYTDYDIENSPYGKDIIGPFVEAYTNAGIDVYFYFSVMDWSHPDWRYDLKTKEDSVAFDRFKEFTKNQLTELQEKYPENKGFWFDGTWDESWKKSGAFSDSLMQHLKSIKPGLVIGSRLRADEYGARHFDTNGHLMGDYEQGWERKLPDNYEEIAGNDWEAVMTIPKNGWGYSKDWMGHWKTPLEILEMMAKTISLDGNFVLNFGPKGDGTFRQKEIEMAEAIGDWMEINSSAIYNSGHVAWEKQDWGYYTKEKGENKVKMIVFNIPVSGNLRVAPKDKTTVEKATFLAKPEMDELKIQSLDYGEYFIQLPEEYTSDQPFIIVLETKKTEEKKERVKAKT